MKGDGTCIEHESQLSQMGWMLDRTYLGAHESVGV